MRVLATSDLHYNVARSRPGAVDLARSVCGSRADVFILAGDVAGFDPADFEAALDLFRHFRGEKLLVAGNHDLWVRKGEDSYHKWLHDLPRLAQAHGFSMLDHGPVVLGRVAFVGNVGWYDYSFRLKKLQVPLRFYRAKVGPGRAATVEKLHGLFEPRADVRDSHLQITAYWRDADFVRLPFDDAEFTALLAERLDRDLAHAAARAGKIVAVTHHLPRRDLVWYRGDPAWDFAAAFLGSDRFHRVLAAYPSVHLCLSGHSHRGQSLRENGTNYVTIGSTYVKKVLMEFEL